jgi:hypothetical protein
MVLFSIHPVPETLKFCELRGKRFETLAKNSGRVVHSSADFHVRSPSNMSARIPPALTWPKNVKSKENATNSACCVADDDAAAC